METIPFILIDDEIKVLDSLEMVIHKLFPTSVIAKAQDGMDGLKLIKSIGKKSIIICDIDIPGFKGLEILDRMKLDKDISQDYFIMTVESIQKELGVKALQHGVDALLHKPLTMDELISCLKNASRIFNLESNSNSDTTQIENLKAIFNKELYELTLGYNNVLHAVMPKKIERISFVAEAALWITNKLNNFELDEQDLLMKSANLIYLGHIGLPPNLVNSVITKDGFLADQKMEPVSSFPIELFKNIPSMQEIGNVLSHIYENVDGSGFPNKLKAWEIPRSSRILRVIKDYEHFSLDLNENQAKAIEHLMDFSKRLYDFDIIALLDQYFAKHDPSSTSVENRMDLSELREGMVVSRNIITATGLLLVPKKTMLSKDTVMKIWEITKSDAIIGDFYVYEPKEINPKENKPK